MGGEKLVLIFISSSMDVQMQHKKQKGVLAVMRWFACLLLIIPSVAFSQNLLLNGGFEEENICSEYKVNCAPEAWIYTVPSFIYYFKDPQLAHTGSHFVALIAGHSKKPFYRSFVRSRLLCALRKGQVYQLSFFVKSRHGILDSIGVYFSDYDFLFEKQPYKKLNASSYLTDAMQRTSGDTNWQKIVTNYKAKGGETFISFGNFSKLDVTGATGIDRENNFFVLFDDVALTAIDANEKLCADWQATADGIYLQDERHEYLARLIKMNRTIPQKQWQATPTYITRIDTLVLPDVMFATNSFSLGKQAKILLDSLKMVCANLSIDSIVVEGHTDNTGMVNYNESLSQNRASAVSDYLMPNISNKIVARGLGSRQPVAGNGTPEERQQNRRVEIYLYVKD
jgi:outer membrane protein OmpA-like peptidoglycan-associated protein